MTAEVSPTTTDDIGSGLADPVDILLFMFFGLCLGILTMQLLMKYDKSVNFPYSVVIFILGFIISQIPRSDALSGSDAFVDSVQAWIHIDAELILFVFLPPLIFGEAMNLNWHHAKAALVPGIALAGPGVIIGAGMMAVFAKLILPHSYNWSWLLCLVFGSVLSATDTVAVLSVLKSTGAGTKLTMLIVGESLLNDGTAMVLFDLFNKMMEGEEFTTGRIIGFILASTIGSALFGIVSGLLVVYWLRSANNPLKEQDITAQTAVTICCAYLIFFVAQSTFQISGALACTFAGGMVSWLGPPIIISHDSMHNVWGFVEWMGNTLIFLLAGLIIGRRTTNGEGTITSIDWLYAIVFYLLMMLTRLILVVVLFPFLSTKNHKCTWQEGIFISWGGLRGALSMTLALIVESSDENGTPRDESFRIFFYTGIIATLTLLVNATLSKYVLFSLKLIEDNVIEKELVVNQIRKKLSKKMNKVIDELTAELYEDEVEDIRGSLSLLKNSGGESNLNLARLSYTINLQQGGNRQFIASGGIHAKGSMVGRNDSVASKAYTYNDDDEDDDDDFDAASGVGQSLFDGNDRSSRSESRGAGLGLRLSRVSSTNTAGPSAFRGRMDSKLQLDNSRVDSTAGAAVGGEGGRVTSVTFEDNFADYNDIKAVSSDLSNSRVNKMISGDRNNISGNSNSNSNSNNMNNNNSNGNSNIDAVYKTDGSVVNENLRYDKNEETGKSRNRNNGKKARANRLASRQSRQSRAKSTSRFLSVSHAATLNSQMTSVTNLLSMARRGDSPVIVLDLVVYIRGVFLEIVRVRYWHLIETGRLPRLSHSSQYLLYSVEVGLDEVRTDDGGMQDWPCIESYIRGSPFFITLLTGLDDILCRMDITELLSMYICKLEAREEKRIVYLLTSFIEAHEHAQSKIHEFIGLDEAEDAEEEEELDEVAVVVGEEKQEASTQSKKIRKKRELTPEEMKVIEESQEAVARAKALLTCIPDETVRSIKAKQTARTVLYKEESMVRQMVSEGLLTSRHAEDFLEEISDDRADIEVERANTYDDDYADKRELRNRKFDAALGRRGGNIRRVNSDSHLDDSNMARPLLSAHMAGSNKIY